ncbi:MAG TPA: hypothetical protein VM487_11115 [Phycisphaerae bacterium]|nr:hypothetical protein [Phycisphaerae bacterium]
MEATIKLDTAAFDRAIADVAKWSTLTDGEIVTHEARRVMRALAYNTPKAPTTQARRRFGKYYDVTRWMGGRARAGWWAAWKALDIFGTPYIDNANLDDSEGSYEDGRKQKGNAHFIARNHVWFVGILNSKVNILQKAFDRAAESVQAYAERQYDRLFKRYHGGGI